MANFLLCLLILLPAAFLISPISGQTCTSQSFSNNIRYNNCSDLPTLNASLHWSYDQSNATLTIAFVAPPAAPGGWIAWAINPTATGMVGSQALIAHRVSNGSTVVRGFNISGYSSIVESDLWFDVLERSGEFSNGTFKIFARLVLPENLTTLNQVWQVGPSIRADGRPAVHEFRRNNLDARAPLRLVGAATGNNTSPPPSGGAGAPSNSPSPSMSPTPRPPAGSGGETGQNGGNGSNGSDRLLHGGVFGLSVLLGSMLALVL